MIIWFHSPGHRRPSRQLPLAAQHLARDDGSQLAPDADVDSDGGEGVPASWHRRPWYVTADFNLSSKSAYLHAANVVEKDIRERELPFVPNEDMAVEQLSAFVKGCMPEQEGAPA